ncbi:MAG: hypothetical protein WC076_13680 [Terrimicrobiaceae bacterium]|jgi:hypothetical protein|nr:hypothetical protein [Terrimicrobiaceae bacterium]
MKTCAFTTDEKPPKAGVTSDGAGAFQIEGFHRCLAAGGFLKTIHAA